jgi:hypothetical protein
VTFMLRAVEQMEDRGEAPTPDQLDAAVAEFPNVHSVSYIQVCCLLYASSSCRDGASFAPPVWPSATANLVW